MAGYTDYARFLEHDLDAVVLANYFHQHTPLAIQALRAGKHVMSETTACFTLAQGVALIEAVKPCSVKGVLPISKRQLAYAQKNWREQ